MAYILIVDGVVKQKQQTPEADFVEVPDWVTCGMVVSGGTYVVPAIPIAIIRERKIAETKAESKRRIIALFPGATLETYRDKELIALMRSSRLLKKKYAGTITVDEQSALDAFDATGAKIDAIILASNEIESDIAASADPANFDVVNSPRWPA